MKWVATAGIYKWKKAAAAFSQWEKTQTGSIIITVGNTQWHSGAHIIMRFIPDTQQPPLAQHCGSLKPLSLWNVPDFQRNKELFGGKQTGKTVCKPAVGRPASSLCGIYFDQGFLLTGILQHDRQHNKFLYPTFCNIASALLFAQSY